MHYFLVMLIVLFTAVMPASASELPQWVQSHVRGDSDAVVYGGPIAWGTGTLKSGATYLWYAHTNGDAYLQLELDTELPASCVKQVSDIKEDARRGDHWELIVGDGSTWVGTSNDWMWLNCGEEGERRPGAVCTPAVIIKETLAKTASKAPCMGRMETKGYLVSRMPGT